VSLRHSVDCKKQLPRTLLQMSTSQNSCALASRSVSITAAAEDGNMSMESSQYCAVNGVCRFESAKASSFRNESWLTDADRLHLLPKCDICCCIHLHIWTRINENQQQDCLKPLIETLMNSQTRSRKSRVQWILKRSKTRCRMVMPWTFPVAWRTDTGSGRTPSRSVPSQGKDECQLRP
jgi:hypothetical protein